MADFVKKTWACDDTITADELNRMENGIEEAVECCEGSGGASMQSVTYSELKTMRDNGTLTAGSQYRITDYECTTTQANSRVVANSFDIIVVADDESTLNENARACLRDGDTYYTAPNHSANLEAWELKYCIDNDTTRFGWADATNGKGVIYWLKDDRNNECPYDFKQIQFSRSGSDDSDTTVTEWLYTFSVSDSEASEKVYGDASIATMDANGCYCYSNIIKACAYDFINESGDAFLMLNDIVFSNTFGNACNSNTFGNDCYSNTFGYGCYSNTFGYGCYSNTFGDDCNSNTFGDGCYRNTFGNACNSNTFGNDCNSNTFGNACNSNTFGYGCYSNTFGNACDSNTFGNACSCNTFGNDCYYIDFFLTNGSGANYNLLTGVFGSNNAHYVVSGTQDNQFATYVGKNSSGVIKTWVPADSVA